MPSRQDRLDNSNVDFLWYTREAGGIVGPDSHAVPIRQFDDLNAVTGRRPDGKRPIIEKPDQVFSNILEATAESQAPIFPMRAAYDKSLTK